MIKGVIIHPDELTPSWHRTITGSDIDVLGIHPVGGKDSHKHISQLLRDGFPGEERHLLDGLLKAGTGLEYELHVMSLLLPRDEYLSHPSWFRVNEKGERDPEHNCCASDRDALDYISDSAERLAVKLPSTTHRYHFWLDDVRGAYCRCPDCRKYSPSDQALIIYNAVIRGLRSADESATQSYLGYLNTAEPPSSVEPEDGIYIEFAPFDRDYHLPLTDERNGAQAEYAKKLIDFFGKKNSQALDYWLDNSLYSGWKKPPKRFSPDRDVIERDIEFYEKLGYAAVSSFACYLGEDYEELYGFPALDGFVKPREVDK